MKLLKTIIVEDFGLKSEEKPLSFGIRESARAVLVDEQGKTVLLRVSTKNYHKLPGGGIEKGENKKQALLREILEETGYKAEIQLKLGKIIEIRDFFNTKQVSFCYIAKFHGDPIAQNLDKYEIEEGHDLVVVDSLGKAIEILENDTPSDIEGQFIVDRDLTLLKLAREKLKID